MEWLAGRFGVSEKTSRAWRPDQAWLLPPSPQDWLPEGHLVYFLMDAVRELDIGAITAHYERELRGCPPFHPRMMLTLLIFGYATGTRSSRKMVHPRFWGDSNEGDEVRRFHPEGMSAISRGLSVRDTPGTTAQKGDLHPEGMLASSECLPISRG